MDYLWRVCRVTHPTARKEHQCSGCGHTIRPGDRYERCDGIFDGEGATWKWCMICIPFEDQWIRPDAALVDLAEHEPRGIFGDHRYFEMDGATLIGHGESLYFHDERATYECHLVPLVGLTRWDET